MNFVNPEEVYEIAGCYVEVTSQCNLRCVHCYNDSGVNKGKISVEAYKELINQFDIDSKPFITISGGEPLMHPDILDFLSYTHDKGITPLMITNATLIDTKVASSLKKIGIDIQVSLNSIDEYEHDLICGEGNFKRTMKGLQNLIDVGIDKIVVRCVLSQVNKSHIIEFISYVSELTDYIDVGLFSMMGRGKQMEQYNIPLFEVDNLLHELNNNKEIVKLRDMGKNIHIPEMACTFGCPLLCISGEEKIQLNPRIDSMGNVFLCQSFDNPMYSLGNIYRNDLKEILSSDRSTKLINFLLLGPEFIENCQECLWKNICGRGCVAKCLSEGTIQNIDGECELRKKYLAQEAISQI